MPSFYDSEVEEQKRSGKVTNVALPILAALEAIGTSIATKGRNPSAHTLGIYKDVQSGREAALERALGRDKATAAEARDAKLLGFQEAEEGRRKSEYEREGKTRTAEAERIGAIKRKLLGSPAETDPSGVEVKPAVPGVEGLTDLDKIDIEARPLEWLTNKLKPQGVNLFAGGDSWFTMPKTGGPATPVQTTGGTTVKTPPKPAAGTGTPKAPAGYRYAADGTLQAIPGGPADPKTKIDNKPPTEDQSKAGNFARRMELAMSDIAELEAGGYDRASSESAARSSRFTPNILNTKEGQRYSNAERNFASANLRKESGAVITPDEMRQQEELYFPRHGDTPETIAQKARNRAQAFEGMKAVAGPLFDRIPSMVPAKASSTGTVWRRAKDGKEYEYDANTKQPTGRSR